MAYSYTLGNTRTLMRFSYLRMRTINFATQVICKAGRDVNEDAAE